MRSAHSRHVGGPPGASSYTQPSEPGPCSTIRRSTPRGPVHDQLEGEAVRTLQPGPDGDPVLAAVRPGLRERARDVIRPAQLALEDGHMVAHDVHQAAALIFRNWAGV